jgi:16S rRNA (guanine527-N7)-methyltransferase
MRSPQASAPEYALTPELAVAAATLFGDRLPIAVRYAALLATDGVVRGLIGPREAPRIWGRHLLNCAAVAELIPTGAVVLDVGSGAGLPGIALAIARPDLTVVLIEPLARRTGFLEEVVAGLGLSGTVRVLRARAEEVRSGSPELPAPGDVVTARALAPLDRLAAWCLPLAAFGGRLLALKGSSASEEVREHRERVGAFGGGEPVVHRCGGGLLDPPTTVIEVVRERPGEAAAGPAGQRRPAVRPVARREGQARRNQTPDRRRRSGGR